MVAERGEVALPARAEHDLLLLLLAVATGTEHLLAAQSEFDRASNVAGGERGERHMGPNHRLAAETATDEVRDDPNPRRREAQQRGDRQLRGGDALRRIVKGQPVAVPDCGGGRRLDRVVVVGGKAVGHVEAHGCLGETRLDVAALLARGDQASEDPLGLIGVIAPLVQDRRRRHLLVADAYQRRGILGTFERISDHDRDGLTGVMHDLVLQRRRSRQERLGRPARAAAEVAPQPVPGYGR